jgi:transposase
VAERSFAWATQCRRLVKDYERYASTLAGLHIVAFACFTLKRVATLAAGS